MNRKLLNGLLVLAVAAGGVGTFTSCKDEDFGNQILTNQADLAKQIQAIRSVTDAEFQANLKALFDEWSEGLPPGPQGPQGPEGPQGPPGQPGTGSDVDLSRLDKLWSAYCAISENPQDYNNEDARPFVEGLYNWMFNEIFPNEAWFQNIQGDHSWIYALIKRASSVELSQTYNPVFGTFNLPVGLKNMMLATYLYEGTGTSEYAFPSGAANHLVSVVNTKANQEAMRVIAELGAVDFELENGQFTDFGGNGNMGNVYTSINPFSTDFTGAQNIQLVNSKGDVILDGANGDIVVEKCDEELSFGITRGVDLGFYTLKANATEANYEAMKFDFPNKSELKTAVKNLLDNKNESSIAGLAEVIYRSMQKIMPAYAIRVWWNEDQPQTDENGNYVLDANGNPVTTTVENSIISSFDLAAAVIHPLSYSTDLGAVVPNKHLPKLNSLTYYLDKIGNKLTLDVKEIEGIDEDQIEFDLEVGIDDGYVYAYDEAGNVIGKFPYNQNGINATDENLTEFVNAILDAVNAELTDQVRKQIVAQINNAIDKINDQLQDFAAQVEDISDVLNRIKNSKKLDYAQKLVDYYNRVVDQVNRFLANPNQYLQVMMAYKAQNGGIHHLSTDPLMPTPVYNANGLVKLYATSYTGDVVVPSYKKYVAITSAVKGNEVQIPSMLVELNQKANATTDVEAAQFNTVLSGVDQELYLNVANLKGYVIGLSYLSVDYHGNCSMQTYYLDIK